MNLYVEKRNARKVRFYSEGFLLTDLGQDKGAWAIPPVLRTLQRN